MELETFRNVGARVITDVSAWVSQVALDMEFVESAEDVKKLGWALARAVAPLCDSMSLVPWPEKYASTTDVVADLLIDISIWSRQARTETELGSISDHLDTARNLATRSVELEQSFADIELLPVIAVSEILDFAITVPSGWNVVSDGLDLRVIPTFSTQLALLETGNEQYESPLAELRVRAIRRVSGSDVERWIATGELLLPGYRLESSTANGSTKLVSDIDGIRASVDILAGETQVYFVQTVCSTADVLCLEFVERLPSVVDYQ